MVCLLGVVNFSLVDFVAVVLFSSFVLFFFFPFRLGGGELLNVVHSGLVDLRVQSKVDKPVSLDWLRPVTQICR